MAGKSYITITAANNDTLGGDDGTISRYGAF